MGLAVEERATGGVGEDFAGSLRRLARSLCGPRASVRSCERLTGGASKETWALEFLGGLSPLQLILRREGSLARGTDVGLTLENEPRVMAAAQLAGVPTPKVVYVLRTADSLGRGYLMERIPGETDPGAILSSSGLTNARLELTRQCAEALARIHRIDVFSAPYLARIPPSVAVEKAWRRYRGLGGRRPVLDLCFRWLRDHLPLGDEPLAVTHGDFRTGNLVVTETGLRAVLDWEMAHIGDPMEDLGWLCVASWRFGRLEKPVGGFGCYRELFAAYEAGGGGAVDPDRVKFWEVFGTLSWSLSCSEVGQALAVDSTDLEAAAIGLRASEGELDLINLMMAA